MKHFLLLLLSIGPLFGAFAQEESEKNSNTDLGVDIVSSYIWRGLLVDPTPNIQGWGEFGFKGFSMGAWASTNFTGTYIETDFYLGYKYENFNATLTNYKVGWDDYFNVKKESTAHVGELALAYTVSDNFPLQILGSVLIYGDDKKIDSYDATGEAILSDTKNYSAYFELQYTLTHGETDISFTGGIVTHESYFYTTDGFAVTNLGISLEKAIKFTDDFSLPINFSVIANPELESAYAILGIRF